MIMFLAGCLVGIGMTVGLFLFLDRMTKVEHWEDPLPSNYKPPEKV